MGPLKGKMVGGDSHTKSFDFQGLRVGKVYETLKLYKYATMELCNYKVIIGGSEWWWVFWL